MRRSVRSYTSRWLQHEAAAGLLANASGESGTLRTRSRPSSRALADARIRTSRHGHPAREYSTSKSSGGVALLVQSRRRALMTLRLHPDDARDERDGHRRSHRV